jgi:hypothetical protein
MNPTGAGAIRRRFYFVAGFARFMGFGSRV